MRGRSGEIDSLGNRKEGAGGTSGCGEPEMRERVRRVWGVWASMRESGEGYGSCGRGCEGCGGGAGEHIA